MRYEYSATTEERDRDEPISLGQSRKRSQINGVAMGIWQAVGDNPKSSTVGWRTGMLYHRRGHCRRSLGASQRIL